MRCVCAIVSSVVCSAVHYFSTLSHKRYDFRKILDLTMGLLIFSKLLSETSLSPRRNDRDVTRNVYWSSCKVAVILVTF